MFYTRVNLSAKAVINGCPGQLEITNNKIKKNYNNNIGCKTHGEIKTMYNVAKKKISMKINP